MASAGDLNGDGFNDVVIGAPMTEYGKGAVYVYHGSANGIQSEPRQVIYIKVYHIYKKYYLFIFIININYFFYQSIDSIAE